MKNASQRPQQHVEDSLPQTKTAKLVKCQFDNVFPLAKVEISKLYHQKTCITHWKKDCGCHAIMLREVQHLGWLCKAWEISNRYQLENQLA